MNRLTQDGVDVCRDLCEYFDKCTSRKLETPIICLKAATYNKLREYELTGLEPDDTEFWLCNDCRRVLRRIIMERKTDADISYPSLPMFW